MVDKKIIIVGFLVLLISLTAIYVTLPGKVKLRVDDDKSTFYVLNENSRWIVSGREYSSIFDGTSKMNRRTSGIERNMVIDNVSNTITITRKTPYIRGPVIIDTYYFDGKLDDVETVPISHKIEIINGSGKFFRYEVRDLNYNGNTYKLSEETELTFGLNMKLELHPNYRWAWVYKKGIVKAQYDIPTDYEVFNVRLFDPKIEQVVWKNNCQTKCVDGKCSMIVGRTVYVNDSDNKCKKVEVAKSLLNSPIKCVVKNDDFTSVECLDFNMSDVKVKVKSKDDKLKKVKIKVYEKVFDEEKGDVNKFEKVDKTKEKDLIDGELIETFKINSFFGEELHIGENSTTIILQDANTENLDDTYVWYYQPDTVKGTSINFLIRETPVYVSRGYIKFNISSIPENSVINEASFYLWSFVGWSGNFNMSIQGVNNNTWTEEVVTWNNQPCDNIRGALDGDCNGTALITTTLATGGSGWSNFTVTPEVNYKYGLFNDVSFILYGPKENESTSWISSFQSKESTFYGTDKRPYLNITYTEADTSSPTYSDNSTNSTLAGTNILHSLKWSDEVGLSGYIFSFCNGTWNGTNCEKTDEESCYQETANVSTVCGGLNTGTYDYTCVGSLGNYYINYSIPDDVSDVNWSITTNSIEVNVSIPDDCFDYDRVTLQLKDMISINGGSSYNKLYCYNGTWKELHSFSVDASSGVISGIGVSDNQWYDANYSTNNVCSSGSLGEISSGYTSLGLIEEGVYWRIQESGGWVNDSFVSFSGTVNWSNVSKKVTSTVGVNISWCVYANDTSNNWNSTSCNNPFTYTTTSAPSDTCTCSGDSTAHEFDCSDNCNVTACTAGVVTFTGVGSVRCNGTWDIDSLGDPGAGGVCTLWMDSECDIDE